MSAPAVSVVMAAYNGAAFIGETIRSVLAQTMPDFEIVVVDDGSRDDTVEVLARIRDPRLRVVRAERNGGPAIARTLALAHARGRFIAGLDQDDLCHPERFARQLAWLYRHPEAALVASTIEMAGDGPVRPDPWPHLAEPQAIDWTLHLLNPLAWSSVMMRGEAARALHPFERDERRYAEDFDLYHRIRAHGRIGRIVEPLVRYRVHPGGASQVSEERMIAAAGAVLAERYAPHLGEERASRLGLLLSRYAGAGYAPDDVTILSECGAAIGTALALFGSLAPGEAERIAACVWWRIARAGLRAGRYGVEPMLRARPAFAPFDRAFLPAFARDAAIGGARRVMRRSA